MQPIPEKLRKEMSRDPFYYRCCISGLIVPWTIKIEWHHNFIFAGKQVSEKWCILPLSKEVHDIAKKPEVRIFLDWIMLNRATDDELLKYPGLLIARENLNSKLGVWKQDVDYSGRFGKIKL